MVDATLSAAKNVKVNRTIQRNRSNVLLSNFNVGVNPSPEFDINTTYSDYNWIFIKNDIDK